MGILSKMCPRFRKTAEELREKSTLVGFNGDGDLDLTIFKAATQLEEAAFVIEGLRIRNDELWDECRRLRLCLSDDAENARLISGEFGELKAENGRLRKLIEDVQGFHECGKDCTVCPLFDQCGESFEIRGCSGYAIIHERMRELGIEVR